MANRCLCHSVCAGALQSNVSRYNGKQAHWHERHRQKKRHFVIHFFPRSL